MFDKHIPPSGAEPRVLRLPSPPPRSQQERDEGERFDAIVGFAEPSELVALQTLLRPGGRLILAQPLQADGVAQGEELLAALKAAGLIHCLVEPHEEEKAILYRGERPPEGTSLERVAKLASPPLPMGEGSGMRAQSPYLFLLVFQTPNKPAWKLAPDEVLRWHAVTVQAQDAPRLLAFTSLVKAVAFMQAAVMQKYLTGINKVGKFPTSTAESFGQPLLLNPEFEATRRLTLGELFEVDPRLAITGEES